MVAVPSIFIASPFYSIYPKITLNNDLFIALHIMYDKIAPEDPIKEPTIVKRLLFNINPSAHNAHPEYELRTVIATGISADPIEKITFHPKVNEVAVVTVKANNPVLVDDEDNIKNNIPAVTPAKDFVTISLCGIFKFAFGYKSANLMKAAIDPVNVIPPINVPKNEAILCNPSMWSAEMKEPIEVATAAIPTNEWKIATV